VFLFSLIFAVISAGNQNIPGEFQELYDEGEDVPNEEY
jgi:hypothetical protein